MEEMVDYMEGQVVMEVHMQAEAKVLILMDGIIFLMMEMIPFGDLD